MIESLALIEPLLPGLKNRVLTDLATQLWAESSALNSNIQMTTILGISDRVVVAVFQVGELDSPKATLHERGQAGAASGYQERQGRKVLQRLLEVGLLISATPKGAVRVGFSSTLLDRYFPRLFLG